jgi:GT2 family glycosyltransferase
MNAHEAMPPAASNPSSAPPLPRASVVIPNWNGARFLGPCLDALDRQSLGTMADGAFEVLVVDNGSTDDSAAVLAGYPAVRVMPLPANLGFAAAVNVGIRVSRAPVIVLLNNDTEAEPGWLSALLSALDAHPQAGMAVSKLRQFADRERLHTTGDTLDRAAMAANRGWGELDRGQYDAAIEVFGANAAAAAYRRALFEDIGWFCEDFGSYMEDVDLAWRARLAGWGCVFAPDAVVYHHVSATGGGPLASYFVARNRLFMIARCYPGRLLAQNLHRVVAAQLRLAWQALRSWRGAAARATLRGLGAGLVGWPRMLHARRQIQAKRRLGDAAMERLMGA